jgi:hypothetical protein
MSQYWISPDGQLYLIDYSHTADFVELKEGDEGYERALFNFRWIPNGTHGKGPWNITKYIVKRPMGWLGTLARVSNTRSDETNQTQSSL